MSFVAEEDIDRADRAARTRAIVHEVAASSVATPFPRMTLRGDDGALRLRQARPALRHGARRPRTGVRRGPGSTRSRRCSADGGVIKALAAPAPAPSSPQGARPAGRGREGSWRCGARVDRRRGRRARPLARREVPRGRGGRRRARAHAGVPEGDLVLHRGRSRRTERTSRSTVSADDLATRLEPDPRGTPGRSAGWSTRRCSSGATTRNVGVGAPPVHLAGLRRPHARHGRRPAPTTSSLNGFEIGGGSIRIHDADMQRRVFESLRLPSADVEEQFGHLLRALALGAPPHGGIAMGVDRLVMLLAGKDAIRAHRFPEVAVGHRSAHRRPRVGRRCPAP